MCRVRSTLHMGERLISTTVKSSECLECHLRVRAVPDAQPLGTLGNVIGRQRETGLSLVPTVGTFGLTYRRGASLSTHLSEPFCQRKLSNQLDLRGRSLVGSSTRRSSPQSQQGDCRILLRGEFRPLSSICGLCVLYSGKHSKTYSRRASISEPSISDSSEL